MIKVLTDDQLLASYHKEAEKLRRMEVDDHFSDAKLYAQKQEVARILKNIRNRMRRTPAAT